MHTLWGIGSIVVQTSYLVYYIITQHWLTSRSCSVFSFFLYNYCDHYPSWILKYHFDALFFLLLFWCTLHHRIEGSSTRRTSHLYDLDQILSGPSIQVSGELERAHSKYWQHTNNFYVQQLALYTLERFYSLCHSVMF